uniref:Intraflagellar transport protein 20 homolog n=1 Tax=Strigamia maritima TaxID=126957 RepID=T1J9Z6_STRMM
MVEALGKAGLYFDELNKIRVLEPDVAQQTVELRDDCKEFVDQISEFQKKSDKFIEIVDQLGEKVDKEKMKGLGSRNLLKSMSKQKEANQQQLVALITEKRMQLERLQKQYESLLRVEADQNEFIEQFLLQK